ncbi:MAG: thiamine pyrophosphate-dependent enzyme [Bacteroidia bacterium]
MNVCDALLDILSEYGVKYIFGIPGDAINDLIESLRKRNDIKFIHVMHEEAGAFAASAQAKLTGELAVCVGTAGPGAIHLLNGLYDAKKDNAPVLAITGQVETSLIGTAYQQEVNLLSLFNDVTVFNQAIVNSEQMPELAILACQTAISKTGVAHLSIPSNVASLKVKDFKKKKQVIANPGRVVPCRDDLQAAADLINRSEKPCILAGIGARNAINEVLQLSDAIGAPIIKALRGKDILPDEHPSTLGGIGLLGTKPSVTAMNSCNLLIIIGSDFPYSDFYPEENIPTIQIDKNSDQIGRRHTVTVPLTGDAELTVAGLLGLISAKHDHKFLDASRANMQKWLREQEEIESSGDNPIHPQRLARSISSLVNDDAIICCDTGTVTVWGARNFRIRQAQRFTLSGDLASMAFALPASIGAQLLFPGQQVIALCGDGGFAMLMCDFATAVKYHLPVKVFIFNNGKLGLIQMEEEAKSGNPEYQTDLCNPDYAAFAQICGGEGYTINKAEELDETIKTALASPHPAIINVFVNPEELTKPPEITFKEAANYSKAKIKEFLIRY